MRAPGAKDPKRIRWFLVLGIPLCAVVVIGQLPTPSPNKKADEIYKNVQVLKDIPSDQLIPAMKFVSSALGVRCEYCHVENAFDKDDKKTKQTARKMMQMMFAINANNFDGHQEVTCYSCHRGNPNPVAIPVVAETVPKLLNAPPANSPQSAPDLPAAAEIVQKYVAALGGADAITKLQSLIQHGTVDAGGRQFPMDILIKSPDRIATVTHFPGGANGSVIANRSEGWIMFPGSPVRAMTAGDLDSARMDSDLQFPVRINQLFTALQVDKRVKIGDADTFLVVGKRAALPPLNMYFDAQTGLLTRVVRYESSPLGLNPTQIDYTDYRETAGVKLPYRWLSATPIGRFTVQISATEPNAKIPDNAFKPEPPPNGAQ
jgi:outer membrane lipoprotein-sorting protein